MRHERYRCLYGYVETRILYMNLFLGIAGYIQMAVLIRDSRIGASAIR